MINGYYYLKKHSPILLNIYFQIEKTIKSIKTNQGKTFENPIVFLICSYKFSLNLIKNQFLLKSKLNLIDMINIPINIIISPYKFIGIYDVNMFNPILINTKPIN